MQISKITFFIIVATSLLLSACASKPQSLFDELGGITKIEEISDNFIEAISYDESIAAYFSNSNIKRFREKLNEHLCEVSGGPCVYTGDSMLAVHTGMNISESHFNKTVELLIQAMDKSNIPLQTQNKLLAKLVPMRQDIIYK